MTNAILRGMTHAGNPHAVPTPGFGAASRFDEGRTASAKPRRGALLCKKAVLWLVAAVLPAFSAAAVPSVEQSSMTVDILVAFDRNAAAYANRNGGVADFAVRAVTKMNTALANNGLDEQFRFRLVGTMEVDAEATDVHAALEAIRDSETGWAEISTKRDEVGADIVTTLIDTGSAYGTTGASWPLTTGNYASFADSAYNVCAVRAVEIGHAMTREVGHNMGAGNATEVADPDIRGPQLHDYSSGYYFTGSDGTRYHTIMADSDDGYGNTYALAPLFSSPTASWNGVLAGDATHDNARTLLSTCAYASNWRAQKVAMSYDVFVSPEPETLFDESISVTLTPGKDGLDIRYTTDGSEPTLTSAHYSKPLKLTRTTTVKAAAVYDGRLGPVYTARYLKRDLATALNAPQLEWTTSPDDPWVAQSDDAFDGFAAKSCPEFVGNIGCGKTSWLKTTVTGPTEMGFRYQKTQYSSAFKVYCDSQVVWSDSETEAGIGGAGWHQAVVNLPEGTHEITFAFEQGYGSYNGFNGIVLDTVCFDAWSASPTIEPETTDDQATATVFMGSMTVTLTPPAGRTGTLFYTLDGSDPTQEGALPYTGPFTVDKSVFVQAVFVEPGRDASAPARGYFLERHPMKPGEWTTDVEGVKAASSTDDRSIAVLMAHRADCDWTKAFMPVAESPEFLTWAEMNGVYLITADDSERVDTEAAKNYFRELYSGQDAIFPTLVFADPLNPDVPLASGVARNDGVATIGGVPYDDTVESLVRGFAAVMGETFVPAAPTASPESELVAGFPVTVTLTNPNASGTIYYTLDGSAPTSEKGTRYAGPIKIVDKKAVLRAAVRLDSGLYGLVLIKSYKTGSDVVWTTLPTGMTGYGYVVSNLTAGAEIRPDNEGGYALPIGAKVGIYAVAEAGYAIVGTNPYVIDEVTADTAIDASALPTAQPSCVVTVGDHPHLTVAWTGGDGSVTNAVDGTSFEVSNGTENVKVIFTAEPGWEIVGDAVVDLGTVTENITFGPESGFLVPTVRHEPVSYIDADGEEKEKSGDGLVVVTSETRFLTDGWYVVLDDIDIAAKTNIVVEGDVHLILCDGASLMVTNAAAWTAAVAVEDGASLSVYGQAGGTGRLTAKGGNRAAGIGCAHQKDCGTISIHGGVVTATGGSYGAGIGSSSSCTNGCVVITGGRIAAAKGNSQGSDIGNGGGKTTGCAVSISGGLFANLVDVAWCAEGYAPVANPDPNTAADYPYTVRPAYRVTIGEHPNVTAAWTCGDKSVTNEIEGVSFGVMPPGTNDVTVIFSATDSRCALDGESVVNIGAVTGDVVFGVDNDFAVPRSGVRYLDWDAGRNLATNAMVGVEDVTWVTTTTKKLADGKWYAVFGEVALTNSLPVEGSPHLILCDWATLAITNSTAEAAISVGDGASLAIYGQTADTGRLTVSGGNAGIGGKTSGVCGAIAIHGGTISASAMSNKYAAGIGSGALGSGGSVTITGGRITAQGGTGAEDIGSGRNATSPCEVFISGGVFAREPDDDWLAPGFAAVTNTDVATAAEYPYAVLPTYPVSWNENTDKMSVLVQMGGETVTDNPVTVLAGDAVEFIVLPKGEYEYAAVPEGWSLRPDGCICNRFEVVDGSIEVTIPEPTLKPYTITYTTGNGTLVTNGVTRYTIETETFSLPSDSDIDMNGVVDVTLRGWKNAAGEVVTEVVKGTSGDLEFFARWASTVSTCLISWNENPGKVSVRAQVDGFDITDNPATVAAGDVVEFIVMPKPGYGYEVAPEGWSLRTDGGICNRFEVVDDSIEVKIPDPTGEPITYTITYFDYGEWIDGFEPVTEYTFETETFNLPVAGDIAPRMGGMFQCWTNEVGETVSEVVRGTEGNLNFYAVWKSAGADPIQAIIGDKVEGFENLPSEKQKAVYDNVQHFYNQFLDVDRTEAWIATVYGEGAKVPAAKFAATTEDLVNVSFKYGLPIMAPPVTIHVTTAAEGLGFTFAITDGDKDAVSVKAANLYGLVKYTASLDDEFHVATDKEVTFDANPDVTFTARFVEGPSAGFMKAELIVPDPAED